MLILKTLALEPMHGYGIGVRLEQISRGVFQVNAGSLFPALRRLERDGLIIGDWQVTENNRRAKYYTAHRAGTRTAETRDARLGSADDRDCEDSSKHRWESCDGLLQSRRRRYPCADPEQASGTESSTSSFARTSTPPSIREWPPA